MKLGGEKWLVVGMIGISAAIIGGGVLLISPSSTNSSKDSIVATKNAKITISPQTIDFGTVSINGQKVRKTFIISNAGSVPLKITNVKTSCTCTTATLKIGKEESPKFSMHAVSSWIGEIEPGKNAELEVVFDQAFHGPGGVGSISRTISFETNDALNPKLEVTLNGAVTK